MLCIRLSSAQHLTPEWLVAAPPLEVLIVTLDCDHEPGAISICARRMGLMPGTVRFIDNKLVFCFPYEPETNDELRSAADNKVRWDAGRRGFTMLAESLRHNPSVIAKLTQFITEHRLDADPEVRKLLAFRAVRNTSAKIATRRAQRTPGPDGLGPGQLRADLLPATTWGSNLRGLFPADWDRLRLPICTAAGNRCEVCGAEAFMDNGRRCRPHCHELWIFEHKNGRHVQRLDTLIALCPDCHRVQHIGLAGLNSETDAVIAKLCEVNCWTRQQAQRELNRAQAAYEQRQRYRWDLDLSALCEIVTIDGYPDLYIPANERPRLGNSYYS